MKLFININGNINGIGKANGIKLEEYEVVKIDEKRLGRPKDILRHIRKPYKEILFGCIDLDFQRFIPFMAIYILLSKAKRGGIVDEFGKVIKFSVLRTIFVTIPLLLLEAVLSVFIVLYSYIYYFVWRKIIIRNYESYFGE